MAAKLKVVTKEDLIVALKSGEYKKAKGQLKSDHRRAFCCLGVICDLAGVKLTMNSKLLGNTSPEIDGVIDGQRGVMPDALVEIIAPWLVNVEGKTYGAQSELALVNDDTVGFGEVIDKLESM